MSTRVKKSAPCVDCREVSEYNRRGLCGRCYQRYRRESIPFPVTADAGYRNAPLSLVVVANNTRERDGGCLIWQRSLNKDGHPIWFEPDTERGRGSKRIVVARWLYENENEQLVKGQILKRTCGSRRCVSVNHASVGKVRRYQKSGEAEIPSHCVNGHELNHENLYQQPNRKAWECRQCGWESKKRNAPEHPLRNVREPYRGAETHCHNGHPYADVGFFIENGSRVCKTCKWLKDQKSAMRRLYGLAYDRYLAMLEEQEYCCWICRDPFEIRSSNLSPHVDHCHTSSKVRGLLCRACNLALGHFKDDVHRLRAAIQYIELHEK
ncbi:endonuclease VII domain-containing protein [Streptomyces sp. NPDC102340]|uniref:endonuclease VII domain-containing protein n=1 Tax=unclassified Streptomyces TaxID=2593676 RepID=UPI0038186F81